MKAKLFILLVAAIPFLNYLFNVFLYRKIAISHHLAKLFPVSFFVTIIGLFNSSKAINYQFTNSATTPFSIFFSVDSLTIFALSIVGFLWLIFIMYRHQFMKMLEEKSDDFLRTFSLNIFLVVVLILSGNLFTILLFQSCLMILLANFAQGNFVDEEGEIDKNYKIFSILLYFEVVLLFLAMVLTYKNFHSLDFDKIKLLSVVGAKNSLILFCFYILALFLPVICSYFFLYRKIFDDSTSGYGIIFFSKYIVGFYLLAKIYFALFGMVNPSEINYFVDSRGIWLLIKIAILLSIVIAMFAIIFSRESEDLFCYLFFQQLAFTLFVFMSFAEIDNKKLFLPLLSSSLLVSLICYSLSNISLFVNSEEQEEGAEPYSGLLPKLPINSAAMIFAIFAICGISPSIFLIEAVVTVKTVSSTTGEISFAIIIANFMTFAILCYRMVWPMVCFEKGENGEFESIINSDLAKDIDFDSALTLTVVLIVIMAIASLILITPLTAFIN